MALSSADAFKISRSFHDLSVAIGQYRFGNWETLSEDNRRTLEDEEWSLLNASSDMLTKAVGLSLDESDPTGQKVEAATNAATKAVKTLKQVGKVINVAAAAVGLAAAIVSKDPGAIAKNSKAVFDAATASV
jgi:hypothetical protein